MGKYVIISYSICKCFFFPHLVKLEKVDNPKETFEVRFETMPAKVCDTLDLREKGFFYRDTIFLKCIAAK